MIRSRFLTAATAAALLALPTAASAGAPVDRTTGGGQILVSTEGGPGSTIAFTAQGTAQDAKGQIQFIDRSAGTGQAQVRAHFVVNCVQVDGNVAYVSGNKRGTDGTAEGDTISLYIVDNGEGMMADMDIVAVNPVGDDDSEEGPCGVTQPSEEEEMTFGLARGNAQTYDADGDA